jgi:hypothetical protein
MKRRLMPVLAAGVLLVVAMWMVGAGAAPQTREPQPVRVDNRPDQPVPVQIENGLDRMVPVVVPRSVAVHTDRTPLDVIIREPQVLKVETPDVRWTYMEIRYPAGISPLPQLQAAGADGWETTGIIYQLPSASAILLKKPVR